MPAIENSGTGLMILAVSHSSYLTPTPPKKLNPGPHECNLAVDEQLVRQDSYEFAN